MVVIIEDVTDAVNSNEEQDAPGQANAGLDAISASYDNEAEEWVKVEPEDAGPATSATTNVPEGDPSCLAETVETPPTPQTEEFKVRTRISLACRARYFVINSAGWHVLHETYRCRNSWSRQSSLRQKGTNTLLHLILIPLS